MAEAGSTLVGQGPNDLSGSEQEQNNPASLKEKVKDLTFMNKVTHLGKQFTTKEKEEWWTKHSKKLKVGLIRNKELDVAIQIFTESFDFSKKLRGKNSGADTYIATTCPEPDHEDSNTGSVESENTNTASEASTVSPNQLNENNAQFGANVANLFEQGPAAPAPGTYEIARPQLGGGDENDKSVSPSQLDQNDQDDDTQLVNDLYQAGFNVEGEAKPEEVNATPETIGTASDFERLYLGWMLNPELTIEDTEKKVRKNTIKSLFRFIFGTKQLNDVTATKIQKKFRIAYTPLTLAEKLPCKDEMGALWIDFRESLVYRRRLAVCELYAARDTLGEATHYVDQKKKLILGIRDLINLLDESVYPCVEYGYNASMMVDDDEENLMADADYVRLLKVFRTFVKDKKEGRKFYSLQNLKREFSKKEPVSEEAQVLYNELLTLLTWTAGEAEATAQIAGLESELEEIKQIAADQEIDIQELEDLVLLLSVVLALSEKMHKIQLELERLTCSLEKCCHAKKDKDRSALQAQLRKLQEDYHILEKKLKKQSCEDCSEVEELEEIILVLTAIITSMTQLHKIDRSLLELKNALDVCCARKKAAKQCEERLAKLERKLEKQNRKTAQSRAAALVAQQGRASANKMIEDLNRQIRDLRQQLERVIGEAEAKRVDLQALLNEEKEAGGGKTRELRAEIDSLGDELRQAREALRRAMERADAEAVTAADARADAVNARRNAADARRNAADARREADDRVHRAEEDARRAREAADAAIEEARHLQREAEEARGAAEAAAADARGGQDAAQRNAEEARRRAEEAARAAAEQQAAAEEARRHQRECDETLARVQLERNAAVRRANAADQQAELAQAAARESERLRGIADAARTQAEAQAAGAAATAAEANGRAEAAAAATEDANRNRDAAVAARGEAERQADEAARAAAAAREEARQAGANRNAAGAAARAAAAEAEALRAALAAGAAAAAADREAAIARLAGLQQAADDAAAAAAARIAEIEAANRNRSAEEARRAAAEIARIQGEAEEAREQAEGAMAGLREQYEHQIEGLTGELAQTRRNRNAARTALQELMNAMREQERAAAEAIAAAERARADAEAALVALRGASEEERAAAAATLAEKQAALERVQSANTELTRQNAALEAANAELATRLAAIQEILETERRQAGERETELRRLLEEARRQAGADAEGFAAREAALRAQHAEELAAAAERQRALGEQMRLAEEAHRAELARLQEQHANAMRNGLAAQKANLNRQKGEAIAGAVGAERARANAQLAAEREDAAAREAEAAAALAAQQRAAAAAAELAQAMINGLQEQLDAEIQAGRLKSLEIANLTGRIRAMEQAAVADRLRREGEEEEDARRRAAAAAEAEAAAAAAEDERRRAAAVAEAEAAAAAAEAAAAEDARRPAEAPSPAALERREEKLRSTKDEFLTILARAVGGNPIEAKQVLKMILEQLEIFGRAKRNSEGKFLETYMDDFLREQPFVYTDTRGREQQVKTSKAFYQMSRGGTGHIFTEEANDEIILPYMVDRIIDLISRFADTEEFADRDVFTIRAMEESIFGSLGGLGFPISKTTAVETDVIPALKELSKAEILVYQMQRALGMSTRVAPPEEPPSLTRLHARMKANPVFMETIGNRIRVLLRLPAREPVVTYLEAYRALPLEEKNRIEPNMIELAGGDTGRQKYWRQTRADLEHLAARGQKVTPPKLKGGGKKEDTGSFCQTMITLLLLEAKQSHDFDVQEFLDKAGTTLDDLGQCPLVLHMLNTLIDESMNQTVKENGYVFSPSADEANEFNMNLEDSYYNRFTPEEQAILQSMGPAITFHSETPEAFREILGTNAYFLNGSVPEEDEETPLYGLGDDEDPVSLTKEEREAVERKGSGVPLGALLFLYLMCLRDLKDSGENPSLDSKCPLPTPLKPSRKSRASTPKRKA